VSTGCTGRLAVAANNSVIGLATAKSLDPASPDYGWVDRGMVLRSTQAWTTSTPSTPTPGCRPPPTRCSTRWQHGRRPAPSGGPSIVWHGRFYYLFASFDFCCRGVDGDYRLMVGRATDVLGPYVDRDGVPMLQGGGSELRRGYNEFAGPGGADVYRHLLVHHYYDRDDAGLPKLSVRPLRWRAGWPVLGDPLSGSREPGYGNAYLKITQRLSGAPVEDTGCGYEGADIRLGSDPRSPVGSGARSCEATATAWATASATRRPRQRRAGPPTARTSCNGDG
jgi:arabinan endo-1,5-alpha-L-arabinosidase